MILDVIIVPESCGREGDDFNVVDRVDHYTICKPRSKITTSFNALKFLLKEIAIDSEAMGQQCHGLPLYSSGLKERAYKVQDLRTSATVLGIVGMGGIGKTTIAMQVFNNISREFEYTCFVENVKGILSYKLERWMCKQFHCKGIRIGEKGISWNVLKGKKTLIVMDDVDSETQLKNLQNVDHFGSGSCLIVTTRNRGVLRIYPQHAVYDVDLLTHEEANNLFSQYAFRKEGLPEIKYIHLRRDVQRVVEKCQGLPLTLELMGCYLRGHDEEVEFWDETIKKLKRAYAIDGGENDRLFASLRVSVDALSKMERKMFIESATYFYPKSEWVSRSPGGPYERTFAAWSTAHESYITAWQNLLSRSMVKEHQVEHLDGRKYKRIWMHEHLRKLAKTLDEFHVVCKGSGPVQKAIDLLNANEMKKETSILELSCGESDSESDRKIGPQFPDGRFASSDGPKRRKLSSDGKKRRKLLQLSSLEKLENLKYITLVGVHHEGTGKNFPKKVSLLKWHGTRGSELPISLEGMNNLAVLELGQWEVKEDFSPSLGSLVKLRSASFYDLNGLDRLPEKFGNLSCLKVLELVRLGLSALPRTFGNLSSLQVLSLHGLAISELPESFGELSSLVKLDICSELVSLPESFGNLFSLVTLEFYSCGKLAQLPVSFGNLSSLVTLKISACGELATLTDSFGNLSSLVTLEIWVCGRLATLPESFGNLSSLVTLDIYSCEKLTRLPESFGNLSSLVTLGFYCEKLAQLPVSLGNLSSLVTLKIRSCGELATLPESFGNLSCLVTLEIRSCGRLAILPESFGNLSSLVTLEIHSCAKLTRLPESFGNLSSLVTLEIDSCAKLTRLPESFGNLASLETIRLQRVLELRKFPDNFGQLKALKKVTVWLDHPEAMNGFLHSSSLRSLQALEVQCESLTQLPEVFGELASLKTLTILCKKLAMLPNSIGSLSSLKMLDLTAERLESLPESIKQLHSLGSLAISLGTGRSLPEELGNLPSLKRLLLRDCPALETLPNNLGFIDSLREVQLVNCCSLQTIPNSLRRSSSPQVGPSEEKNDNKQGQSTRTAAAEEIKLTVSDRERVDDSMLERSGWEKRGYAWYPRKDSK